MSHNFRTLTWKKKNQTGSDHFKFLMNSTNAQRSFVHELASQQLGHPPSNLWGVPIPQEFHQPADQKTLQFVRNAAKHPSHEFGRLISSHKTASGFIGALGDMVGSAAKSSAGYLGKVGRFIGTHGSQIKTGVAIAKDLVATEVNGQVAIVNSRILIESSLLKPNKRWRAWLIKIKILPL